MRDIRRERVYACSAQSLWQAIATQEGLSGWLMTCDFAPASGHEFTFRTKPAPGFDGVVHAKVLEISEPCVLRLAWRSGRLATEVCFTIEPVDASRTRLLVEHTGFSGMMGIVARMALGSGWKKLLRRHLPQWLDKARGHTGEAP